MINTPTKTLEDFIRDNLNLSIDEIGSRILNLSKETHTVLIKLMLGLKIVYGTIPGITDIMIVILSIMEYNQYKQQQVLEPKDN